MKGWLAQGCRLTPVTPTSVAVALETMEAPKTTPWSAFFGDPDRRHGIRIPAVVGKDAGDDAGGVFHFFAIVVQVGCFDGKPGIGVGHGNGFAVGVGLAFFPFALEIEPFLGRFFAIADPMRFVVFVDQDVGKNDFAARFPKQLEHHRVIGPVDVFDDAENAVFRIDAADGAVIVNPDLSQIIADEFRADHGRRRFTAAAGRGACKKGNPAARTRNTGNKHVLGQFLAPAEIGGPVHGKAVVSLFSKAMCCRRRCKRWNKSSDGPDP